MTQKIDTGHTAFAIVPIEVALDKRLTLEQTRVLIALFSFRNRDTGLAWPSRSALSERTGMHPSNISAATTALARLGWLTKDGNGGFSKSSVYAISTPDLFSVAQSATLSKTTEAHSATVACSATVARSATPTVAHSATTKVARSATPPVAHSARGKEQTIELTIEPTKEHIPPVAVAPVAGPVFPPIDDIVVEQAKPAPVGTMTVANAAEVVERTPTDKPKRKRTVVDTGADETALQAACRTTWAAYSGAYAIRYGVAPLRNAKVNAAIKGFVQRIGHDESPAVAAYYVSNVNDAFVVRNMHDTGLLLKQAEGYRTQWATGRSVTATAARQADQTAANLSVVEEAKLIARARRAAREAARLAGEDFL